jgi:quinol monooxygenase YgiN
MPHDARTDRTSHFAYLWQYTVDAARRSEFLELYGRNGAWVQLFSRDSGYIETELLQDADDECRFVTIDYWSSREAHDAFRVKYDGEFRMLDEQGATFTVAETFLGDFTSMHE